MSEKNEVIDLLSDDDEPAPGSHAQQGQQQEFPASPKPPSDNLKIRNPYLSERRNLPNNEGFSKPWPIKKRKVLCNETAGPIRERQAGIVLEEDVSTNDDQTVAVYVQAQQEASEKSEKPAELFTDEAFPTLPSSIQGAKREHKKVTCRCRGSQLAKLDINKEGRPFYRCARRACKFYTNAFAAESFHWYRFGPHNGHCIVQPSGFTANDLRQGRVGDCWFLSALAVVAERPDLISRLFPCTDMNEYGITKVNLFLDGYWKPVVIDNFLPCQIDPKDEAMLRHTLRVSNGGFLGGRDDNQKSSSKYDPATLSDTCRDVLSNAREFLEHQIAKDHIENSLSMVTEPAGRNILSGDLAYSKGLRNQLWVPFVEKAYAKSHGSYQAISGGHVAEAFLDLTGAPTQVFRWLDSPSFDFRNFWYELVKFRKQRLPMGCGTDQSQVGIIGMHAYSILDVVEVKNVGLEFYQETGAAHGGMSGFGPDGTVRLLQIRNPHGKSEWTGHFSDKSEVWEKLIKYSGGRKLSAPTVWHQSADHHSPSKLERTMNDDGKFWIDFDSFLQGFSNVDVVLAFVGNHAKSFGSTFPPKKSNHRCTRAFEVTLLDESRETVDVYIMGIQKTRRGAGHGRADRKVSYKVCDLGMLIGESQSSRDVFDDPRAETDKFWENFEFSAVNGQMFGFQRNGHHKLVLRRNQNKTFIVLPISFGHPAATDKELSFVLRFVGDAPLLIRELPAVPRLDRTIQQFCLASRPLNSAQGRQTVILKGPAFRIIQVDCLRGGGGVVFLYLCVDEHILGGDTLSISMEVRCRGMSCRTASGLLQHETIAKGKQFEAAWRLFKTDFVGETKSRLLAAVFQSGQDCQFGSIVCKGSKSDTPPPKNSGRLESFIVGESLDVDNYSKFGIFNSVKGNDAFNASGRFSANATTGESQNPIDPSQIEDLYLQHALEASRQEASTSAVDDTSVDFDFALAVAASKAETVELMSKNYHGDDQLKRAIELSLRQSQPTPTLTGAPSIEVVDLTDQAKVQLSNTAASITEVEDRKPAAVEAPTERQAAKATIEAKRRLAAEAALRRYGPS